MPVCSQGFSETKAQVLDHQPPSCPVLRGQQCSIGSRRPFWTLPDLTVTSSFEALEHFQPVSHDLAFLYILHYIFFSSLPPSQSALSHIRIGLSASWRSKSPCSSLDVPQRGNSTDAHVTMGHASFPENRPWTAPAGCPQLHGCPWLLDPGQQHSSLCTCSEPYAGKVCWFCGHWQPLQQPLLTVMDKGPRSAKSPANSSDPASIAETLGGLLAPQAPQPFAQASTRSPWGHTDTTWHAMPWQ